MKKKKKRDRNECMMVLDGEEKRQPTINNNPFINCANKCSSFTVCWCKGFFSCFVFTSTMMARRGFFDKNQLSAKQCAGTMKDFDVTFKRKENFNSRDYATR